jgi:hypothetical protein
MTLGIVDTATVAVTVQGIDLIALKKLSLVSHALAKKIGGYAGQEQATLATVLDDLIRQIELACVKAPVPDRAKSQSEADTQCD